ncbi:SPOR domain-containing protein [Geomonas sp. Red32]|uniref:SPOR domain-containing protein n=1 Tax=Geomonas sp. Red32 TaxID=2912856 RepID=UPI00202CE88A|nr:SPOR domain-containing protein [Geomonas sp. Red32]MCM0083234.1 SPOR domain-containing protein [Geomonas sp. Red32]
MVIDYSEKRPGGVREGGERRPVQKNRPRKEPGGLFALIAVAVLAVTFGAGVFTGWLLFKGRKPQMVQAAPPAVKTVEPTPAAPPPQTPAPDTPLTFYKTLPAGGKAPMGSGLNLKSPEAPAPASRLPQPAGNAAAPAATAPAAPAPPVAPAASAPTAGAPGKEEGQAHFVVQIASYRSKQEADAAQTQLGSKGVAAYVVESKVAGKGVWYRVRIGHRLSKAEAESIAAKNGKGSLVLPE